MKLYDLRTEYKVNPIGITEKNPRFSWKLESDVNDAAVVPYCSERKGQDRLGGKRRERRLGIDRLCGRRAERRDMLRCDGRSD